MNSHVVLQVSNAMKHFGAQLTHKEFMPRVGQPMLLQILFRRKILAADLADMFFTPLNTIALGVYVEVLTATQCCFAQTTSKTLG
jgi:hypothetical protein